MEIFLFIQEIHSSKDILLFFPKARIFCFIVLKNLIIRRLEKSNFLLHFFDSKGEKLNLVIRKEK